LEIKSNAGDSESDDQDDSEKLTGFEDLEKVRDECEKAEGVLRLEDCLGCRITVEDPKRHLGEHLFCCDPNCECEVYDVKENVRVEVKNNNIFYDGKDTSLELDKKTENKYLIESGIFNNNVGTIINGEIEIYEDHFVLRNVDKDVLLHIEEDYVFRDGRFVRK
ncbi:MAG: hypothetical protein U9Q73_01665, partial [Nanoarchaeota archaeon]|nr:hypothetical protein [Nanoarchaeota archaeon]